MRTLTIELPDTVEINGAKGLPEQYRTVKTDKWGNDFIIMALEHAMSQKIGDPFGNKKNPKHEENAAAVHKAMEEGTWARRERTGESAVKFQEKVNKLSAVDLAKLLSPEQQAQLLAAFQAMRSE